MMRTVKRLLTFGPRVKGGVCFAWPDLPIIRLLLISLSLTMSPFTATEEAEDRQVMRDSQATMRHQITLSETPVKESSEQDKMMPI